MENSLVAERAAAQGSLAGWRKMVRKAVHAETGHLEEDSVRERLKSLDAAWVRFDKAHHSVMNSMAHDKKEEEQEDWEKQMEEYCLVKEEGISALKKFDLSYIQVKLICVNFALLECVDFIQNIAWDADV